MPHTDLPGYIYHLSWFGIFLWFAFLEQLTPIPEEISLMTLGYISVISSAAFYVTAYMLIGILFHRQLGILIRKLKYWQHIIFIASMVGIAIFLILTIRKLVIKK